MVNNESDKKDAATYNTTLSFDEAVNIYGNELKSIEPLNLTYLKLLLGLTLSMMLIGVFYSLPDEPIDEDEWE